ncbi:MAG: PBSX family phage terminase large subunit [Flavobacteriaceae bacterium]|nr:PBSX family phage terminase large subunit [Flavobacteriaceae bacterium]
MGRIKLNAKYKPLWSSDSSLFIITGGRGSAKSFHVSDFCENLTFEQGHTILFTRYTLTSAHISIIPEFEEKIELEGHIPFFNINKTEIVNNRTQSNILFRGIRTGSGTQTANLKSIQNLTTWVLDEAEELTDENIFDKINESVRKKGIHNRVILVLNPPTKEHFIYKRFFQDCGVVDGWNGTKNGITYIHTTYLDNIHNLSQKFIDNANDLKEKYPEKYKHRMLGAFLDKAEGIIFENWKYGEFDESLPFGYGMDFGFFPDPDVVVKCAIDFKRKILYVKSVLKLNNAGTDKLAKEVITNCDVSKSVIADCAENRLISDLKSKGVKNIQAVKKFGGSVLAGIKTMLDFEIIVDSESTGIGVELNNYAWSDKKNGVPIDAYNHNIDAIRYYVMTFVKSDKAAPLKLHSR